MSINKKSGYYVPVNDLGFRWFSRERILEVPVSTYTKKEFFDVPLGSKFYRRSFVINVLFE